MAEGDEWRVEARTVLTGRGMGVTPEKIAELQNRAAQMEKLNRPKPTQDFSKVLAKKTGSAPAPEPTEKQQKYDALPKKGPRPRLLHPAQREEFGREDTATSSEPVIIKG